MHIIAVANEKGGVAKTTTVISLGGALVDAGHEVLLVDLDSQANMTLGLGMAPAKQRRSIADVLLSSASILSVSRETGIPGLDLVPSSTGMGLAERFLPVRNDYEFLLKNALEVLTTYDYVLLDCPPSLGAVTLNALTAADRVITPTQPEYFSAYGLRSVMALIRKVRGLSAPNLDTQKPSETAAEPSTEVENSPATGNPAPNPSHPHGTNPNLIYNILITMMDRRNRIHRTLSEQLRTTFGDGLLTTVIEVDTKLRESTVAGQPITHYYPKSRSADQYRALAEEIIQYAQEKTSEPD